MNPSGVCYLWELLLLFSFLAAPWQVEFQARDQIWDTGDPGDNARSLTHCAGLGMEPAFQSSQDIAGPVAPLQELLILAF